MGKHLRVVWRLFCTCVAGFLWLGGFFAEEAAAELRYHSPLEACAADCGVSLYAGRNLQTGMGRVFFGPVAPWDWQWGDSYLVGGAVSRPILTFRDYLSLEPELGLAKRFGELSEAEVWAAFYLRWHKFPWNHLLRTSVGVSFGLNYATGVPKSREFTRGGKSTRLLHFLSPEITFAPPDAVKYELLIRFHHRSGAFGLIRDVGGVHHIVGGVRLFF